MKRRDREPAKRARLGAKDEMRARLDEELLHVMSLDSDARASHLAQLAVTDPDLSDRLRRLIDEASDLPSSFLAAPAADALRSESLQADAFRGEDPGTQSARPAADKKSRDRSAASDESSGSTTAASGGLSAKERYRVEKLIGAGGMAKVYLARDTQLGRRVALKLLDRSDAAMRRRFQREARSQARVDHPNILEIYETGEIEGRPYIAMRYVEGCTLLEAVEELTIDEKVDIFCQICEGLHAAHRKGLLHRDVKPSNVLVEESVDGFKAYVGDFGIAVAEEPESTLTTAMAGTPAFIAPERLTDGEADRRSDIYSLGVTMYQVFTGELPFAGDSMVEVMRKTCAEEPTRPRELASDLPKQIEDVILTCMAKDPEDRYDSARLAAHALRGEEADESVPGTATTGRIRAPSQAASGKASTSRLLAAALVLALSLWGLSAYFMSRQLGQASAEIAAMQEVNTRLVELFEAPPGASTGEISARDLLDRGVVKARLVRDSLVRGRLLADIGRGYRLLGADAEAAATLDEASILLRKELGEDHPEVIRVRAELDAAR